MDRSAIAIAVTAGCAALTAHWVPWYIVPGLTDRNGRLRRLFAYSFGLALIWATVGLYLVGDPGCSGVALFEVLTLVLVGTTVGTLSGYGIDTALERRALEEDLHDYEQTFKGRV